MFVAPATKTEAAMPIGYASKMLKRDDGDAETKEQGTRRNIARLSRNLKGCHNKKKEAENGLFFARWGQKWGLFIEKSDEFKRKSLDFI